MKKRILVIDDEDEIRRMMFRMLSKAGYDILVASNGKEALEILDAASVDLIMLDMNMPTMNGFDFLKRVRENDVTHVPVLMVSGETDPDYIVKSYKLGVYDFIKKPEQTEIILKRVENGLKIGDMINFNDFIKIELLMARKLQKYLFPKHGIATDWVNIYTWSRPLSDIGGDLYDYIAFRDNRIIFFVADVSGHSISAALYTAIVKMVFRNAIQKTQEPGEIMSIMNSELSGNIPIESFVTMFCGLLSPDDHLLKYANAGHPRPLCFDGEGVIELQGNDSFLGPISDAQFSTFSLEMDSLKSILVYTDGILDVMDGSDQPVGRDLMLNVLNTKKKSAVEKFKNLQNKITGDDVVITDDCTLMLVDLKNS